MEYMLELSYGEFLLGQVKEQIKMDSFITECMILAENKKNSFERIAALNEAEKGKLSNVWDSFKTLLKKIWDKFVGMFNKLTMDNKKYLERYKDTILKKPLKLEGTCLDYRKGIKMLHTQGELVMNFTDTELQKLSTEDDARKTLCPSYKPGDDYNGIIKSIFISGLDEAQYPLSDVFTNMTDMYNYCHDYEKIKNVIEKDVADLNRAIDKAKYILQSKARANPAASTESKTESSMFDCDVVYSRVLESYITEDEKESRLNISSKPTVDAKATPGAISKSVQVDPDVAGGVDANSDNIQDLENKMENYRKAASTLLTGKLNGSEIIYKDVFKVLQSHIKSYGGEINKQTSAPASTATNFNK